MQTLTLSRSVGNGAINPVHADVVKIQTILSKIRNKLGKVFYAGRIDGKCKQKTIDAICAFQMSEKIKVTGVIERTGQTITKLKQKAPNTVTIAIATNVAQSKPTQTPVQKNYTLGQGVKLTPAIEQKVARIANAYHAVTGKKIRVNSGTRTPATQAAAMVKKMKAEDKLTIYRQQNLAQPILAAFQTAQNARLSDADIIQAVEQVIASQVTSGQYISKHLIAGAVDIRSFDMSASEKKAFKAAAAPIAASVLEETTPPHWHLQF